jgi:ankyrin repeat protein
VKLILDSPQADKLIIASDKLGNLPLHFAAKSPNIPLTLSIIFAKTPQAKRNSTNEFGNTPLSEALLND